MTTSRNWIAAAVLAAVIGAPAGAEARTELLFGHVGEPGSLFAVSAEEFARRANERLEEAGLDYEVRVFGSSQLGNDQELLQRLRAGTVDFALPSTIMSSVVDEFGLFEMPYLVRDREHMRRIEEEIFWPVLEPLVHERGYRTLAVWENGFRHITNNVRPIVVPEDLRDLRLRTPRGAWRVRMFETYGANPSPMAFSEVFMALQTGVMDGQENPFAQIASARFQEAQDYLSLSGHVYTPAYALTGAQKWATHPEELQALLEGVARETQAYVYETAAAMEDELLGELGASMEVNEVDIDAFIAASQPVYGAFAEEVPGGGELVERALALGEAS
jgi:TRAP-type transport system periplasmic protein